MKAAIIKIPDKKYLYDYLIDKTKVINNIVNRIDILLASIDDDFDNNTEIVNDVDKELNELRNIIKDINKKIESIKSGWLYKDHRKIINKR